MTMEVDHPLAGFDQEHNGEDPGHHHIPNFNADLHLTSNTTPPIVPFTQQPYAQGLPLPENGGEAGASWGATTFDGLAINAAVSHSPSAQGPIIHSAAAHISQSLPSPPYLSLVPDAGSGYVTQLHIPPYTVPNTIQGLENIQNMIEPDNRNLHVVEFLMTWSRDGRVPPGTGAPRFQDLQRMLRKDVSAVTYSDLYGDHCDFQGIDWPLMGVTRRAARQRRKDTFINFVNIRDTDSHIVRDPFYPFEIIAIDDKKAPTDKILPNYKNFFRFRRTDKLDHVRMAHFQLRDLLSCPSRTQALFPTRGGIRCMDPLTGTLSQIIRVPTGACFSSLTAGHGVVMAGDLHGSYYIQRLDAKANDEPIEGSITRNVIVNHLEMYQHRGSNAPHVAVCSNDNQFRVMDVQTQAIVSTQKHEYPYNCSAVSTDGRLRAMVGDFCSVDICDTASGKTLQSLTGHRDFGFASAWSDNGWTLATGNQDKRLCIWDARKWCDSTGKGTPVTTIWSEIAGVRSLKFSPVGSGEPVLLAAEEVDFVNIIDAQTYNSKQTIDLFGSIGGCDFANEGRNINVLCSDPARGGLLQFERCGLEAEPYIELQQNSAWVSSERSLRDMRPYGLARTAHCNIGMDYVETF